MQLAPGGRERLDGAPDALLEPRGARPALVDRLADEVESADDLDRGALRPYALADAWGEERRAVLELFLLVDPGGAARIPLGAALPALPRARRQGSERSPALGGDVHCDACGIDVDGSTSSAVVELVVPPEPGDPRGGASRPTASAARQTDAAHRRAAASSQPGERRTVRLALEPGAYRVRAGGLDATSSLAVADGGAAEAALTAAPEGVGPRNGLVLAPLSDLTLRNETEEERLLVAERTAWADDAATAADVTALQAFRDLFATEALRPGEAGRDREPDDRLHRSARLDAALPRASATPRPSAPSSAISTSLRDAVAREGGAVVKTIGDAVMAVFRRPVAALEAMLDAQAALAARRRAARSCSRSASTTGRASR